MNDIARALDVLGQLRDVGIAISLDDFGTGHSSLSHLSRLPVDEVKIDKSFVLAMLAGGDDDAIVSSTITLGHSLGLIVVAEGVESAAAWQALRTRGCDAAQGYYLSRPLPASEFDRWLAAGHWPVQTAGKPVSDDARVNATS